MSEGDQCYAFHPDGYGRCDDDDGHSGPHAVRLYDRSRGAGFSTTHQWPASCRWCTLEHNPADRECP